MLGAYPCLHPTHPAASAGRPAGNPADDSSASALGVVGESDNGSHEQDTL